LPPAETTGNKTVLFVRVRYADDATDPQSYESAVAMMDQVNTMLQELSYGKVSLTTTVTPLLTIGKLKEEYLPPTHDEVTIRKNARAQAIAAGYDYDSYDFQIVRFHDGPGAFAVWANIGSPSILLKVSDAAVVCHGLLHNLGLWHAHHWQPADTSAIGAGGNHEQGDPFDAMGAIPFAPATSLNAYERNRLHWLPDANVLNVTASGTYRIYALDQPTVEAGKIYGLKVRKDGQRYYWLDFRQQFTSNPWVTNGVTLYWEPWTQSHQGTQLLDTTPTSANGTEDAALGIGQTFTDSAAGISITPIGKGGTTPESMEVRITLEPPGVTAEAGPGQTLTDADRNGVESVTLTGAGSTGAITNYVWYDGASPIATDVSPAVDLRVGQHWITLMVTDGAGATAVDPVVVTVEPGPPPNQAPIADAGPDQSVTDTDLDGAAAVTLDGAGSTDLDGTVGSYVWNGEVEIAAGKTPVVYFKVGGPYTIKLKVTDNEGAKATDTVQITVKPGVPPTQAPIADAGPD
jgi:hypothetical protein